MANRPALTVLAGGVGAAKFLRGLLRVADPSTLTIIVNTGDDERFFDLAVSPDLDTITYTAAGVANPRTGWGRRDDSFHCLDALGRFYDETWFRLGDRDLATHIYRTQRLAAGARLSSVTAEVCRAFGIAARILPMSDDPVRTVLDTAAGTLTFQDYLVRRRARPAVRRIRYLGAERARPAPGVVAAIRDAAAVVIAPSNPLLSIGPLLAVPGIRRTLERRHGPTVAVSPLVGGRAPTGPLARQLRRLGLPASSLGIAACYRPFLDALVIDHRDRAEAAVLAASGCRVIVADTLFSTEGRAAAAARRLLRALA
ncbi:MAG: 2-phospho-L-lactate transferase [Deltaproteobacteria bacterium]|nr:2-phospho-L-lactate transferase [Deltaproteobacteria bacterium]